MTADTPPLPRFAPGDRVAYAGRPGRIVGVYPARLSALGTFWASPLYSIEFDDDPGRPLVGYRDEELVRVAPETEVES